MGDIPETLLSDQQAREALIACREELQREVNLNTELIEERLDLQAINAKLLAVCKAILKTPDSFSDFVEAMALAEAAVAEAEGEG